MAGEGFLDAQGPGWDMRPGDLDPMRGWALPAVAGRHESDGWKVWLSALGFAVSLPPQRARQLAQDILDMCDVIEGRHPALEGKPA
jgi:hypothetical protein